MLLPPRWRSGSARLSYGRRRWFDSTQRDHEMHRRAAPRARASRSISRGSLSGRAPALQAGRAGFDSQAPHQPRVWPNWQRQPSQARPVEGRLGPFGPVHLAVAVHLRGLRPRRPARLQRGSESFHSHHAHVAQLGRGAGLRIRMLEVRILPWVPLRPCSPTGRGARFRIGSVGVRISPWPPRGRSPTGRGTCVKYRAVRVRSPPSAPTFPPRGG